MIDLSDPANSESGAGWLGIGPPLVIGVGFMVLGAVLMLVWSRRARAFLGGRAEVLRAPDRGRGPAPSLR